MCRHGTKSYQQFLRSCCLIAAKISQFLSAIRKRRVGGRLRVAGAGLNRDLTARCGMAHCFFVSFATALDRQFKPKDWVFHMPNLSAAHRAELKTLGVELIVGIPNDFLLSRRQSIIRDVRTMRAAKREYPGRNSSAARVFS